MSRALKNPDRPRRVVNKSARRDEVLAAAMKVFAEQGFAGATMRDIAAEIGILAGSLYHHFQSKDEILIEILRTYFHDVERDLRETVERDRNAYDTLEAMLVLSCRYIIDRKLEATIARNELDYLARSKAAELEGYDELARAAGEAERIWLDVIRRGIRTGQIRDDVDPGLLFRTVIGSIYASTSWYDPAGDISRDEFTEQTTRLLLEGVRARTP